MIKYDSDFPNSITDSGSEKNSKHISEIIIIPRDEQDKTESSHSHETNDEWTCFSCPDKGVMYFTQITLLTTVVVFSVVNLTIHYDQLDKHRKDLWTLLLTLSLSMIFPSTKIPDSKPLTFTGKKKKWYVCGRKVKISQMTFFTQISLLFFITIYSLIQLTIYYKYDSEYSWIWYSLIGSSLGRLTSEPLKKYQPNNINQKK